MIILFYVMLLFSSAYADPAFDQLCNYKENNPCSMKIMTTSNGAPVEYEDMFALNSPSLMANDVLLESIAHQMEERIPERVVHAKGAGAFGYFEVTHNVSDICKANLFCEIGKKTPVVVRFSQSSSDKGEPDTQIDSRGFAVKFFSEEGNFDIVGFHTPMFMYKEPFLFQPIGRVIKRNPVTNLRDPNMLWDLMGLRPETINFFLYLYGDNGIPYGYRHMPGFSVHTYQVYTKCGKSSLVRFHMIPDKGIRNFYADEALEMACADPDFAVRDLYNAIAEGDLPTWTVSLQVVSYEDAKNCDFDVFDITKTLPEDKYPLRPVGKLVLDKNPTNYFADVEQLAFCPGNVVPGILGAPDKAFESRRFAYKAAQRYRLGSNFNKILVNCPIRELRSYDRDGVPPIGYNGGDAPNYYPNSFHGSVPYVDKKRPRLIQIKQKDDSLNFDQPAEIYSKLTENARKRLVANLVFSLSRVTKCVQQRIVEIFNLVHADLGYRVTIALAAVKS